MMFPVTTTKKIGIFRALQLGDMLCSVPAIRSLRAAYPNAEIVLFGLPWAESFVKRFEKYIDRFIHFPGYPGLPEQLFSQDAYQQFKTAVVNEAFDLLLQMQGNGTIVNEMLAAWGSKNLSGFAPSCPTNGNFMPYPEGIHEIERHLALMAHLGLKADNTSLEFPVNQQDRDEISALDLPFSKGEYVCIHPGSRGSYRQWPPTNFAAAAQLCHDLGYKVVFTGIKGEQDIVQQVSTQLSFPCINLCNKTSLGAAALLIQHAALIVCNCTGVSHIAAAMQTPGVIISMDGEPERWGPLNRNLHSTINWLEITDLDYCLREIKRLLQQRKATSGLSVPVG